MRKRNSVQNWVTHIIARSRRRTGHQWLHAPERPTASGTFSTSSTHNYTGGDRYPKRLRQGMFLVSYAHCIAGPIILPQCLALLNIVSLCLACSCCILLFLLQHCSTVLFVRFVYHTWFYHLSFNQGHWTWLWNRENTSNFEKLRYASRMSEQIVKRWSPYSDQAFDIN